MRSQTSPICETSGQPRTQVARIPGRVERADARGWRPPVTTTTPGWLPLVELRSGLPAQERDEADTFRFASSAELVARYVVEAYGVEKLPLMVNALEKADSLEEWVMAVTGQPLPEFEAAGREWVITEWANRQSRRRGAGLKHDVPGRFVEQSWDRLIGAWRREMGKKEIPVAVLGATGAVGQRFVQLLADHPWFEITAVAASERSAGRPYAEVCSWVVPGDPPPAVGEMVVRPLEPRLPARIVFSALPAAIAREVEPIFAQAGYAVCSNASAFRYEPDVPLIIPEVDAGHLALIERQRAKRGWSGLIVTSPNCTTTGIVMPLKPLDDAYGLRQVFAASMQAISGAGYPGVASLDILDNVVPYIGGEEEKIQRETRLLLGSVSNGRRTESDVVVSAQANRVPVLDGHTICLSVGLEKHATPERAIATLSEFRGPAAVRGLPSAPECPVLVRAEPDRPQPRRDRDAQGGMSVTVGRVRECPILDLRMVSVSHNTLRGAASGSILNAELLVAEGYVE